MPRPKLQPPLTYLITSGETTRETTPACSEFLKLLALVEAAIAARVSLVQLREKRLSPRVLYELASRAAALARDTTTLILVNDRADAARAARCDGVHLTTRSLDASTVRSAFGPDFLVGVSTHNVEEARAARHGGADFAVFGPVFDTPSKLPYGPAVGLDKLGEAARALSPFPLLALGGVTRENVADVLSAGASGVAGISMFADASELAATVKAVADCQSARDEG